MAKTDYFLKIDGIEGESQDEKMKGCIDLQSWSWGESNSGSFAHGGGGGAGKVAMQDFHFTMQINKASPKLSLYCATGKHIPYAELTCRKAGDKPAVYLKIKLSDVLISSYQTGGSANADILPYDQVSINFAKIEGEYFIQDNKGATSSAGKWGYDLKANKSLS
ncbi:MAG TPA: type VI secretion system tube protein Hcp [Pyrinomonadaceae bacterium]|jgi:type VI secretion system secreted protein Hcp|nr:type VI secretion system tube protein Hcp [Pyrinomonadaceae bacterium]